MALTPAEKQRRYRERQSALASSRPDLIEQALLQEVERCKRGELSVEECAAVADKLADAANQPPPAVAGIGGDRAEAAAARLEPSARSSSVRPARKNAPAGCAELRRSILWRGPGSLAAEPRSPAPKTWVIRAEYRGGNWPNTRNPAGDTDGVGLAVSGGIAAKLREWDSGDRGDVLSTSRTI